jgi:hypothetical protein
MMAFRSIGFAEVSVNGVTRSVSGICVAAWVMTSIVVAIAYMLCLGTAEAVTPHPHSPTRSV